MGNVGRGRQHASLEGRGQRAPPFIDAGAGAADISSSSSSGTRKKRRKAPPGPGAPAGGPRGKAAAPAFDLDLLNFNFAAAAAAAVAAPLSRGAANPLKMPRPSSAGFFKQTPQARPPARLHGGAQRGPAVTFGVAPLPVSAAAVAAGLPGWVPAAPVPVSAAAPPGAAPRRLRADASAQGGEEEEDGAPFCPLDTPLHGGSHGGGVGEGLGEIRFGYGQWGRR